MRRKRSTSLVPPHGVRAMLPVFAVQGGAGRSTVAGLLAQVLATSTRTVVVDTAPRSGSPWPDWLGIGVRLGEHPGLPGLAELGRAPDRAALTQAATRREVPVRRGDPLTGIEVGESPGYDVLADTRPFTRPPVEAPEDPRWYARLLENGGWFAGIVDFGVPATAAHILSRNASQPSLLDRWFARKDAVPVLVASSSAAGPARLQRLIALLDQDGLPAERAVAAIVNVTPSDRPKWLDGELGTLAERLHTVVEIPYDKSIRLDELTNPAAVSESTLSAARRLAASIVGAVAHHPVEGDEDGARADMAAYRAEVRARAGEEPAGTAVGAQNPSLQGHPAPAAQPGPPPATPRPAPQPAPSPAPATGPQRPAAPASPPGQTPGGWVPDRHR